MDLGITFQNNLSFNKHMSKVIGESFKIMGVILRNCRNFKNLDTLLTLFTTMVRPKLEYASEIWSPNSAAYKDKLEAVQRRFLKFLYYKKFGAYPAIGIDENILLREFQINSLEERRTVAS